MYHLSEKSIHDIIEGNTQLFTQAFMVSKAEASDMLACAGVDEKVVENVRSVQLPNPFIELESIYKQNKYFKECFNLLVRNDLVYELRNVNQSQSYILCIKTYPKSIYISHPDFTILCYKNL